MCLQWTKTKVGFLKRKIFKTRNFKEYFKKIMEFSNREFFQKKHIILNFLKTQLLMISKVPTVKMFL